MQPLSPEAVSCIASGFSPAIWIPCVYFLKGLSKSEDTQFLFTSEEAMNLHPGRHTHTCARILHMCPRIQINCPLSVSTCYLSDSSVTKLWLLWRWSLLGAVNTAVKATHCTAQGGSLWENIDVCVRIMIVVCLYLQMCWTGFQRLISDAYVIQCRGSTLSPCPDKGHHGWL